LNSVSLLNFQTPSTEIKSYPKTPSINDTSMGDVMVKGLVLLPYPDGSPVLRVNLSNISPSPKAHW
jgi:hypothetical protein